MFASATFRALRPEQRVVVPATAVLRLHDQEFVFQPLDTTGDFRRVQIKTGSILEGNLVEVLSGLSAGQQVVANALELQNTAAQ